MRATSTAFFLSVFMAFPLQAWADDCTMTQTLEEWTLTYSAPSPDSIMRESHYRHTPTGIALTITFDDFIFDAASISFMDAMTPGIEHQLTWRDSGQTAETLWFTIDTQDTSWGIKGPIIGLYNPNLQQWTPFDILADTDSDDPKALLSMILQQPQLEYAFGIGNFGENVKRVDPIDTSSINQLSQQIPAMETQLMDKLEAIDSCD